ncbi:MAG: hypothetical protein JOZ96_05490 [Acidobacteria bacterium]|nr:hypothetical protein [Acidobacteriota bacterium]
MPGHPEIEIPIVVKVKPIGSDGSWEVVDVVDARDGTSLADLDVYSFDEDSDFMTHLERSVLESLLENEGFDAATFYTLTLSVRDGGRELESRSTRFSGGSVPRPPRNWRAAWLWPSVAPYLPYLGRNERREETAEEYARRMQSTILPHWPGEPLREWLHRHFNNLETYAFLDFERLRFERQTWDLKAIPGHEAFADPHFCDSFSKNLEARGRDWLAQYMLEHGTWPTPILLLENLDGALAYPHGEKLNQPYHLLEGHRRLSFLNALRQSGRALPQHDVWLVRKAS